MDALTPRYIEKKQSFFSSWETGEYECIVYEELARAEASPSPRIARVNVTKMQSDGGNARLAMRVTHLSDPTRCACCCAIAMV